MSRLVVVRPCGLLPDDEGEDDSRDVARWEARAARGSTRLRKAILRLHKASAPKLSKVTSSTWEARKIRYAAIARLQYEVATHFGIPVEAMTEKRGPHPLSEKRSIAMYLAREVVRASYPDIGRCFSRDHSTVMHACRTVHENPELASLATHLRERIVV